MGNNLNWKWVAAGCLAIVIVAAGILGSSTNGYQGSNARLYEAVALHHVAITRSEADTVVDQIADKAKLSHKDAEDVAVEFARAKVPMPVSTWPDMAITAKAIAAAKRDGVD